MKYTLTAFMGFKTVSRIQLLLIKCTWLSLAKHLYKTEVLALFWSGAFSCELTQYQIFSRVDVPADSPQSDRAKLREELKKS